MRALILLLVLLATSCAKEEFSSIRTTSLDVSGVWYYHEDGACLVYDFTDQELNFDFKTLCEQPCGAEPYCGQFYKLEDDIMSIGSNNTIKYRLKIISTANDSLWAMHCDPDGNTGSSNKFFFTR